MECLRDVLLPSKIISFKVISPHRYTHGEDVELTIALVTAPFFVHLELMFEVFHCE